MDLKYNAKQLVSVEYPGTVNSVPNMEKTLGGPETMFSAFQNAAKRLELKFRPDDPFCKPAHGDRFNSTNIVLKVIRRTKRNPKDGEADVQLSVEMLGVVNTTYKFKSMADFQILPLVYDKAKGEHKSLLTSIVPQKLHSASWLEEEVDLFVPPILFSRFDLPQTAYAESQPPKTLMSRQQNFPQNVIGRGRKRRAGYAVFKTFDSADLSETPKAEALKQLKLYPLDMEVANKIEVLFKEKPIWSRNSLLSKIRCDKARMKLSLPCCGYYFYNGPWRALWVCFGYDPRKDPTSKIYQTMDVRLPANIPLNEKRLKSRSAYYALPTKTSQNHQRGATINTKHLFPSDSCGGTTDDNEWETRRLACEYFPGYLPSAKQCFYQLCDIHLQSVQDLVHQNDGREKECTAADGWLEPGTLDKVREMVIADIMKTGQAQKDAETSSVKD